MFDVCRHAGYFEWRPGASVLIFIARPGQSAYYTADGRKMANCDHMPKTGYFVRKNRTSLTTAT